MAKAKSRRGEAAVSLLKRDDGALASEWFPTLEEARASIADEDIREVLAALKAGAAAGVWNDLSLDQFLDDLDRARHAMPPSGFAV